MAWIGDSNIKKNFSVGGHVSLNGRSSWEVTPSLEWEVHVKKTLAKRIYMEGREKTDPLSRLQTRMITSMSMRAV